MKKMGKAKGLIFPLFKFNKGEWSESLVFWMLVLKGFVTERLTERRAKVLWLSKEGTVFTPFNGEYFKIGDQEISCSLVEGSYKFIILGEFFSVNLDSFRDSIKKGSGSSFLLDDISKLTAFAGLTKIKAPSREPSDLSVCFDTHGELTVSIKSGLGKPTCVVNASRPSNFIYTIKGVPEASEAIAICPCGGGTKGKTYYYCCGNAGALIKKATKIEFTGKTRDTALKSLPLDERSSPLSKNLGNDGSKLMAAGVLAFLSKDGRNCFYLKELLVVGPKILGWGVIRTKRTLRDVCMNIARGMTPAIPFDGTSAVVSHLAILENGDLYFYHMNGKNQDEFFEHMIQTTYFDQASRTKHDWGRVYRDGSDTYIQLNLMLRQDVNPKKVEKKKTSKKTSKKIAKKIAKKVVKIPTKIPAKKKVVKKKFVPNKVIANPNPSKGPSDSEPLQIPREIIEANQRECKKSYRSAQRHLALYIGREKGVITREGLVEALTLCGSTGYSSFSANLVQNMSKESSLFVGNHKDGWKLTTLGKQQATKIDQAKQLRHSAK